MKNIPNILSGIRILLIPVFAALMLTGHYIWAGAVLVVSAASDVVDGIIARRFNWVSNLGKVLDPVADKLTQAVVCIVLAVLNREYIVFSVIMIAKEIIMVTLGGWLFKKRQSPVSSRWFGKAATVMFYFTMCLLVFFPQIPKAAAYTLLGITTALVLFAFANYAVMFVKLLDKLKKETAEEKETADKCDEKAAV